MQVQQTTRLVNAAQCGFFQVRKEEAELVKHARLSTSTVTATSSFLTYEGAFAVPCFLTGQSVANEQSPT